MGYHPKCENLSFTHLSFADDILVFSDGNTRSIESILEVFGSFVAGVDDAVRQEFQVQNRLRVGALLVRYLGLPLLTKTMGKNDYQPLI